MITTAMAMDQQQLKANIRGGGEGIENMMCFIAQRSVTDGVHAFNYYLNTVRIVSVYVGSTCT